MLPSRKDGAAADCGGIHSLFWILSQRDDVTINDGDYDDGDEIDSYNDNDKGYHDNDNDDEKW